MTEKDINYKFKEQIIDLSKTYRLLKAHTAVAIAINLYNLRKDRGLTQRQLAAMVRTSPSAIIRMETPGYSGYTLDSLAKLAFALEVNIAGLLSECSFGTHIA